MAQKMVRKIWQAKKIWWPQEGPQTKAFFSEAEVLFFGGGAGGGKTDMLLGTAYHNHARSIIFRREYPQFKQMIARSKALFSRVGTYNKTDKIWTFDKGTTLEFGSVKDESALSKYQGQDHDFIGVDELTHFMANDVNFLLGWMRTALENQRARAIFTGNPPLKPRERWVVNYFAPWLDTKYHGKKAAHGEIRYFAQGENDREIEVDQDYRTVIGDLSIKPTSKSFIQALVTDNKYYRDSAYVARLNSMHKGLRDRLLYGLFDVESDDDPDQLIPTEWVKMAMERWRNRRKPEMEMSALGVDVARGGKCNTVLTPRYGNYFGEQIIQPGSDSRDGKIVAQLVLRTMGHKETCVNIDALGVGSSPYDFLKGEVINLFPIDSAGGSKRTDKSGFNRFANKRAEMWFLLYEALDPKTGEDLAIPDDQELLAELTAVHYDLSVRGIKVQDKDEIGKELGKSPDKGDSLVYAFASQYMPRIREL